MPRPWLLPIGRLHKLAGRELATGCRSRRDLICYCRTCTSDFSREDTVGCRCTSPIVNAVSQLKDGSPALKDFTYAPMHAEEILSEVTQHTVGFTTEPMKEDVTHMKLKQEMRPIAPLKPTTDQAQIHTEVLSLKPYLPVYRNGKKEQSPPPPHSPVGRVGGGSTREKMPRPWLLPIGRLHKLAGRELATGCRSRRDLICYCRTCTSDFSREDTVGCRCTSPIVNAVSQLKDGLPALKDFTYAPMHAEKILRSEVTQHTVGFTTEPMKEDVTHMKLKQEMRPIAPLKGVACSFGSAEVHHLKHKAVIPSITHLMFCKSYPRATKKASNQDLSFMRRRNFSSDSVSMLNSIVYGSGDKKLFDKNLESASNKLKVELGIESLKAEFRSLFRPQFVANCLMLPSKLNEYTAAYLHGQVHGFSKLLPLYLSSLDVMLRVRSLSKDTVHDLVDYIIQRRILISEDWDNTYGNIEVLSYDANANLDTSFVRAECDAAFEPLNENGSGVAKVAILIWKGNKLIYADVIEGIESHDSVGAEIKAGLALLMKCKEFGFQKVELWSDSKRVCGVISGAESIYEDDKNRDNCLLLRCMQNEFAELIPVFKPRELMFLTDHLLKLEGTIELKVQISLEKWAGELKGGTIFCVTYTKWASKEIKSFGETRIKKKHEGYVYKPNHIFFWKVEKGGKFAALSKLREVLCPNILHLVMDKFEEKPEKLIKMVSQLFQLGNVTSGSTTTFMAIQSGKSQKRPLVVVWDSCLYKEDYEQGSCVILLVEDDKEVDMMVAANISEMNISTYLYFNQVEFKEEQRDKGGKQKKRSKWGQK